MFVCMCVRVSLQGREWCASDDIHDDEPQQEDSMELRLLKGRREELLAAAAACGAGLELRDMVSASMRSAKIPGVSHAEHNIVSAAVPMLADSQRIHSAWAEAACEKIFDRLVQDLEGVHGSGVPETEYGLREAMQMLAKYARDNPHIKTEKGMARLPTVASTGYSGRH